MGKLKFFYCLIKFIPTNFTRITTMFRNQYDNDVTVWSPQGRIHQIEYAMEAVKQGSATVGIKSSTHVVMVALKRAPSDLSAHQKKILQIDDHCGIAIAGLTADARILSRFMRMECLNERYAYDRPMPVTRLVGRVGAKSQIPTQRYGRRPFGVGLLVAGLMTPVLNCIRLVLPATFTSAKRWPSAPDLKAPEPIWRSISTRSRPAAWKNWSPTRFER